ncbi:ScbR family autoregulator-binding transcription factor [Kitasatospora sp. LaBMicrA B282]|uniref:ScbR family autoregulator-binding transcription factor n=1 Tax=Kitasatospora sp. LaBMicrA B282 TaxID=3420949 RepID=UPI003D0CC000
MPRVQQDRAVRTRGTLLRAAAQVFDEYGFNGSSINKIIKQAGITQGAMYFHFRSKEELARAVISAQAADLELPGEPRGLRQLIELTLYVAHQLRSNVLLRAGTTLALEQGAHGLREFTPYEMWADTFRRELAAARQAGELLPELDVEEIAELLVAAYTGAQVMSCAAINRAFLPQRVIRMWWYLLPGIAPAPLAASLREALAGYPEPPAAALGKPPLTASAKPPARVEPAPGPQGQRPHGQPARKQKQPARAGGAGG